MRGDGIPHVNEKDAYTQLPRMQKLLLYSFFLLWFETFGHALKQLLHGVRGHHYTSCYTVK
jgi:hypothetical protein